MSLLQDLEKSLNQTQWQSLAVNQNNCAVFTHKILKHAIETVPFYQKFYQEYFKSNHIKKILRKELNEFPILTRSHIQRAEKNIISQQIPSSHGSYRFMETSGSTGQRVKILTTDLTNLFYHALMLREHSWHRRDCTKTLMSISWLQKDFAPAPLGYYQDTWGTPFDIYNMRGSGVMINISSSTESQIEGILHYKPAYLITYPSQAAALATFAYEHKLDCTFLKEIRTTGETLTDSYRNAIRTPWENVNITDIYSCVEIGNIASQCAEYGNYHVNTEHVCVEIVNDKNQSCQMDEPGKILLTSLANYATPLIRYEIGDYGAWGNTCPCGRGLPVIKKIYGRTRNRLRLPNGESRFPYFGEREDFWKITDAIVKFQLIQHSVYEVEYKLVVKSALTIKQEEELSTLIQKVFGFSFNLKITYHNDIPAGSTGKFEEFISFVN